MSWVTTVLAEPDWLARRERHVSRMRAWTVPHHQRRERGEKHPVLDFLFTYYSHRPARLERWHPGAGVALAGESARSYLRWPAYVESPSGVTVDVAAIAESRLTTAAFIRNLLTATASRAPRLACFGLHEWAMVYRQSPTDIRHLDWPLRLGADGTDAVVDKHTVRCSHFDAFRFFTPAARPLNAVELSRDEQARWEQPGCLHATMDLFKWAYKLDPYTPSDLMADCFELAGEVREMDMRASPYDLSALGYPAVPIETEAGRAEYVAAQRSFAARAQPLRAALIELCDRLLAGTTASGLLSRSPVTGER